ncbi:NAD(P)-dependent glycerol-3-phosphate dehydrogenase [Nisaea acidiphila]|uniref:Glycerol-3-phosphate dehydrogenase [NAD(P)+] n=1 Tax=Nisaea acidiphila TaxID=1862145 RepID=A0A9J7AQ81_9PROT|nr:NAD(P)H-dependent glycerol-3-phosphate dehydrogenase [Nisaea acidiphila]UUX48516.1 NAD(P)-dependent glycerol-3-phosphate dehydrogenase [Nisaea acidiphila]
MTIDRIAVLGAGAWGTALALEAHRAGRKVTLWTRRPEQADEIRRSRENAVYLPGIALPDDLAVTSDPAEAIDSADVLLLVVPAQHMRAALSSFEIPPGLPLVSAAKGIENTTDKTMSEVLAEMLPDNPAAVLSGPSFAGEAAAGKPTAVTLAAPDERLALALIEAFGTRTFRPYGSTDLVGAEVGGAVKNVLAIAAGIVAGMELGENARAALITRGLAEATRFAVALGGRAETLMGLSGIGDLVLTCSSTTSRNFSLGARLGKGEALEAILGRSPSVVEGVFTAASLHRRARTLEVEMPIAEGVDAVLNRGIDPGTVVKELLSRPVGWEFADAGPSAS